MIVIPLDSSGARSIDIDLENDLGVFTFRSYWNSIMQTWNLDITDDQGGDVILGLPLVVGIDILKAHPAVSDRIGQLRVVSFTADNNRTEESLGDTAELVHFAPEEFAATYEEVITETEFLPVIIPEIEDVTQPSIC